jgi:hypothetical protein
MTAYEAVLAERRRNRRIARRIEAAVVILILAAVAFVYFEYHPERAGAVKCSRQHQPCLAHAAFYNHVSVCEGTLRGAPGDDDVHSWGVAVGASSFGGWGGYGHYSDGSVYVWGSFNFSYGKVVAYKGRCSGGDYASDWFVGF